MDKTSIRQQDSLAADATGAADALDASTQPRQFFRVSSRVFCLNGEWYFQTRENDHGPFTKREAAEQALERYASEMQDIASLSGSYPTAEGPSRTARVPASFSKLDLSIL